MEENGIHYTFRTRSDKIVDGSMTPGEKYRGLREIEKEILECYATSFQDHAASFQDHAQDIKEELALLSNELKGVKKKLDKGSENLNGQLKNIPHTVCALEHIIVLAGRRAIAPLLRQIIKKK